MERVIILSLALSSFCLAQTIDEVVIPRKTEMFINLERALNTRTATPGDSIFGVVAVPLTQNDKIIIPVGSFVKGQVETSKKPGRIKGTGELTLRFNLLILPDGTTREFQAMASSAEGYETKGGSEEGKIKAQSDQASDVGKGAIYGAPVGAAIGATAGVGAYNDRTRDLSGIRTGALVGAGAGAGIGALVGLLFRNEQVDLTKGTVITVVLDKDVRFVKPAPETPKKPL
jgi:type IV secretion system protein VirB10